MNRCASYPAGSDDVDRAYVDSFTRIPDGSFVEGVVTVLSFVTPAGENGWLLHTSAELPATQVVGLLACGQMEVVARTPGLVSRLSPGLDDDEGDEP